MNYHIINFPVGGVLLTLLLILLTVSSAELESDPETAQDELSSFEPHPTNPSEESLSSDLTVNMENATPDEEVAAIIRVEVLLCMENRVDSGAEEQPSRADALLHHGRKTGTGAQFCPAGIHRPAICPKR